MSPDEALGAVRARIAELEQREAAMRTVRMGPVEPGLVVAYLRERGRPVPDSVHLSDCALAGKHTKSLDHDGRGDARKLPRSGRARASSMCTSCGLSRRMQWLP
ncbi:hypothetical protein ACFWVF_19740 [Streptomyces sp. NPDC058659]|uniref:hypothetical protein n=1 Tax=unclassified Streptomyces TaxID=2593676 RepID=UPI00365776C7